MYSGIGDIRDSHAWQSAKKPTASTAHRNIGGDRAAGFGVAIHGSRRLVRSRATACRFSSDIAIIGRQLSCRGGGDQTKVLSTSAEMN